jgi:hypothetical protein
VHSGFAITKADASSPENTNASTAENGPSKVAYKRCFGGCHIYISGQKASEAGHAKNSTGVDCESLAYIDEGVEGTDPTCSERTSN